MALIKVWKSRLDSDHETALQEIATTNKLTLEERAIKALESNKTFLALTSPTNAQVLAQVKALTRQVNGVMRLSLNKLDKVD